MSPTTQHVFSAEERIIIRKRLLRTAHLVHDHAGEIHYSEGPLRWSGIASHQRSYLAFKKHPDLSNAFPHIADCSAMVTWMYWDACLKFLRKHNTGDFLNGSKWQGGYTGTLLAHGHSIGKVPSLVGDLVIYGTPGTTGKHVAMYIGNGLVLSHGSEAGPFILPYRYRTDVQDVRRYL